MKKHPQQLLLLLLALGLLPHLSAQHPVGVNLASFRDWSSEFVFKDAFRMCREWTQINLADGSASGTFDIPLRPDGYPTALPFADAGNAYGVRTFLFTDATYPIPAGNFTLISEGAGMLRVRQNGGVVQTFSSPGTHTIAQTTGTHFIIDIIQSDVSDPVRNIRFVMPGFLDTYQTEPFHPAFLAFLQPFNCLRFMDWMRTNGSMVQGWSDRTPANYYSQTLPFFGHAPFHGVAYEYLVDLCNTLGKDAWVNIPHQAGDDYVQQLALFLRDRLSGSLKIYLEYSNETWNTAPGFTQSGWVLAQGQAAGYPAPALNQRALYTAKRSADVFRIFESTFGSEKDRLVKVLAAQAGNTAVAQTLLNGLLNNVANVNPTGVGVDALAIAPYFGNLITGAVSVDDALNQADAGLALAFQRMDNHRNLLVAQGWDLPLIAYEGGQHLNGPNAAVDALFCSANRHERMGELYCQYFQHWFDEAGGGLFVHYNSVSPCSNSGSWGLKEYTGQPDGQTPKWRALLECALVNTTEAAGAPPALFQPYPNPFTDLLHIRPLTAVQPDQIEVLDACGRRVLVTTDWHAGLNLSGQTPGLYFLAAKKLGVTVWRGRVVRM